jgi:hypothetical protein
MLMTKKFKRLILALTAVPAALAFWALISFLGYETTFDRDQLDGLKKGMSRAEVAVVLRNSGVSEMESQPDRPGVAELAQQLEWVNLQQKDFEPTFRRHDAWRYQVPNSYSTVDLRFAGDTLVSITYRWRPFEG